MKATIYANYGVLGHEKTTVYTATAPHEHATISEKVTVDIPDSLNPYTTVMDEIGIEPENAYTYTLSDILFAQNDAPAVRYANKDGIVCTVALGIVK